MKMPPLRSLLLGLLLAATNALAQPGPAVIELQTNIGTIAVRLDWENAPITAENFAAYAQSGFYDNTIFHRMVKNFVVQGGGYDRLTGLSKLTQPPILLESDNGLSNVAGTIAMARTNLANSATSQFFFNLVDNPDLDYVSSSSPGYAVFGRVIKGMPVVKQIGAMPNLSPLYQLPYAEGSTLVWIEAAYANNGWNRTISRTRIRISGNGTVTSEPAGIRCGADCVLSQTAGTALTLTTRPGLGYAFGGWRGDCQGMRTVLALDTTQGNHNCTAVFDRLGPATQ